MRKPSKASSAADKPVAVRFLVDDTPFVAGQVYELDRAQAEKLVERAKVAEYAGR